MRYYKFLLVSFISFLIIFENKIKAQNDSNFEILSYNFTSDSLIGFDEVEKIRFYDINNLSSLEKRLALNKSKREFIKKKYNLTDKNYKYFQNFNLIPNSNLRPPSGTNSVNAAPCVNEDFEASPVGQVIGNSLNGWTVTSTNASNTNCGTIPTSNPGSPKLWVLSTPITDPIIGVIPASPLGGTKVIKLNNNSPNGNVTKISQTFPVTGSNALFQFVYAGAWQGSHACCDSPAFNLKLKDCLGNPLPCPVVTITPSSSSCLNGTPGYSTAPGSVSWTNWQLKSIDLTPYINSCITIEVTVADCIYSGHYGYCYFDAICKPLTLMVNNNLFPAGTAASTVVSCGISTATMVAPGGLGPYNWAGPAGSGINNNINQSIQTSLAGTYTLTMNPPGSCAPIVKFITVQFPPAISANFTSSNNCNVFTFINTGTQAPPAIQTYSFLGSSAPPSFTTTSTNTTVIFPVVGTYTVIHIVDNGCTATVQAVINTPPALDPSFSIPTSTQCLVGNNFNFNASSIPGTHVYTFSPTTGAPNIGNSANYGPVSFTSPGTYTVYHLLAANGCSATSTSTIFINSMPNINITSQTNTICIGNNLNLSANGANDYIWSPNTGLNLTTGPTVNAGPNSTTEYTVFGTQNTCTASAVFQVSVIPYPNIITSISNSVICGGESSNLTANGATSYSWSPSSGLNSTNSSFVVASPSVTTEYTLTGFNGGCSGSVNLMVEVVPYPNMSLASPNYEICRGQSTKIEVSGAQNYTWTPSTGLSNVNSASVIAAPLSNINYTIFGINQSGTVICSQQVSYSVIVIPIANPIVSNSISLCQGEKTTLVASGGNTIIWTPTVGLNNNLGSAVIASPTISTLYNVDVSNNGFCGSSKTIYVQVNPNPKVKAGRDTIINVDQPMFLSAIGTGTMTWIDGEEIACKDCPNSQVFPTRNSCYVVETVNEFGCKAKDKMCIDVSRDFGIYIPNAFSPNGDGINDEFLVFGYNISEYYIEIFDRWGEFIFNSKDISIGWKGTYKNKICQDGMYIYKVSYKGLDGIKTTKTGHVTLNR